MLKELADAKGSELSTICDELAVDDLDPADQVRLGPAWKCVIAPA